MADEKEQLKENDNDETSSLKITLFLACAVVLGSILLFKGDYIQPFIMNELDEDAYKLVNFQLGGLILFFLAIIAYVLILARNKTIFKTVKTQVFSWITTGIIIFSFGYVAVWLFFLRWSADLRSKSEIGVIKKKISSILSSFFSSFNEVIVIFILISIIIVICLVTIHLTLLIRDSFKNTPASQRGTMIISIFALLIAFLSFIFN